MKDMSKNLPFFMLEEAKAWLFRQGRWSIVDDQVEKMLNKHSPADPWNSYRLAGYHEASQGKRLGLIDNPHIAMKLYVLNAAESQVVEGIPVEQGLYPYLLEIRLSHDIIDDHFTTKIYLSDIVSLFQLLSELAKLNVVTVIDEKKNA